MECFFSQPDGSHDLPTYISIQLFDKLLLNIDTLVGTVVSIHRFIGVGTNILELQCNVFSPNPTVRTAKNIYLHRLLTLSIIQNRRSLCFKSRLRLLLPVHVVAQWSKTMDDAPNRERVRILVKSACSKCKKIKFAEMQSTLTSRSNLEVLIGVFGSWN